MLGKLPVLGCLTNLEIVGQGPTVLTVGAGGAFYLSSIISFFFLPSSGKRPDID